MRIYPTFCLALASSAVLMLTVGIACAESGRPKTLLRWSYDPDSDEGGPDLDKPLETDRPDFTTSPVTVGQGVVQIEGGYTYTRNNDAGVRTIDHSFPETLLRVGAFADWLEFRATWNYEVQQTKVGGITDTASGADDLILGTKICLTPQDHILPETGIVFQLSVPTGGDDFTANKVLPGVIYCYDWELNKQWSLGGSTSIDGAVDDVTADPYSEFSQSLSLEYTWTEQVKSYTEWYLISPISADTNKPQYYFDGGFTVYLNNNVQWDIRAGVGLNDAADDFYAGTGLSIRYF